MKTSMIKTLQRWARTILSPSQSELNSRIDHLHASVVSGIRNQEKQDSRITDLMESVLFSRWEKNPTSILSRSELGHWLNFLGLYGKGVEVGVHRGAYSEILLQTWKGQLLYSVDPWIEFDPDEYKDDCNLSLGDQHANYLITIDCLRKFKSRSNIIKLTSLEAAEKFHSASLDFVYIDAQHHYEAVRKDIEIWEKKIKKGGVIGGHDYLDGQLDSGLYGVKRAVDEWVENRGYELLITRDGPYPSWFVIT